MSKSYLITGATGKQGGSTIRALLAHPKFTSSSTTIYAITRDPTSRSAVSLAQKSPSIKLITGNLNDPISIFASIPEPLSGVFSVQLPGKNEVKQGESLINAAAQAGVEQFVYTGVDRGGEASESTPTDIPHFKTKHEIEKHLEATCSTDKANNKMSYTILRPVFFMDNLSEGLLGRLIATSWKYVLGPSQKLQMISTTDIGFFAAKAFMEPEKYKNRALTIAGDELSFEEANAVFQARIGKPLPLTYTWLARLALWLIKDVGSMFAWFKKGGFGADLAELRQLNPHLTTLDQWVQTSNHVHKGEKKAGGWM